MNFFSEIMSIKLNYGDIYLENLAKQINASEKVLRYILMQEEERGLEEAVIIAIYRKLIEQLDGYFILLDHDSNSAATSVIRSLFETYIGLRYILEEKNKIKERALSYRVYNLTEQRKWIDKAIESGELSRVYTNVQLSKLKEDINSVLNKEPLLSVYEEWKKTEISNGFPKWYSNYKGPKTFTQLAKLYDKKNYQWLYSGYSLEAHGYKAMSQIIVDKNEKKHLLQPIRYKSTNNTSHCKLSITMVAFLTEKLIKIMCPEILNDYEEFYYSIRITK